MTIRCDTPTTHDVPKDPGGGVRGRSSDLSSGSPTVVGPGRWAQVPASLQGRAGQRSGKMLQRRFIGIDVAGSPGYRLPTSGETLTVGNDARGSATAEDIRLDSGRQRAAWINSK